MNLRKRKQMKPAEEKYYKSLGKRLRFLRESAKISAPDLAHKLKVPVIYIFTVEKGSYRISAYNLNRYLNAVKGAK